MSLLHSETGGERWGMRERRREHAPIDVIPSEAQYFPIAHLLSAAAPGLRILACDAANTNLSPPSRVQVYHWGSAKSSRWL